MRKLFRRLWKRPHGGAPPDLRAVFLHISKTAGQSVRVALAQHPFILSDVKQPWLGWEDDYSYRRFAERGFASVIREEVGPEVWERCFNFAFVRNPFDRAVSAWRYLDRPGEYGHGMSFADFLHAVTTERDRYRPNDHQRNKFFWHVEPQAPQILGPDGAPLVDFIGRTERLQSDFDHACGEIGIPQTSLPRVNTTERDDYRAYYTTEARIVVARHYAQDVETFGYSFDGDVV